VRETERERGTESQETERESSRAIGDRETYNKRELSQSRDEAQEILRERNH
jgi:hypothetical protein